MTTRDLFGLALRLLGLWTVWTTLNLVLGMILGANAFFFGVMVWQAAVFLVGLWMLRGATQLVDYAYPPGRTAGISSPTSDDSDQLPF